MNHIPLCVKTPKGIEEVEKRTQKLAMRARQVLIMIDGKRDENMLMSMFPGDSLHGILEQLINEGFIQALQAVKTEVVRPKAAPPSAPAPLDDQQRYDMACRFMINTLQAFVGMIGSSLILRIEKTADLEELRHYYTEWRDAIRLSSDGRARLPELEQRLAALLS